MNSVIVLYLIGFMILAVNITTMFLTFPCKRSLRVSLAVTILYSLVVLTAISLFNMGVVVRVLSSFVFLPLLIGLFRAEPLQVVFAFTLQSLMSSLQNTFAAAIAGYAFPNDEMRFSVLHIALAVCFLAGYLVLVVRYGRQIFQRLFVNGYRNEWVLYSLAAILSYGIATFVRAEMDSGALYIALLLFILWTFVILCFAIINTHEKTKKTAEAEFARSVVSSGLDHYRQMDEMYEKLRVLRHDYKYHLSAAREMLDSGDTKGADEYLTGVENQLSEYDMRKYCSNAVINALVAGYAERCQKLNINLNVNIKVPEALRMPDYDLCIIIGNLLENAVEACEKLSRDRIIKMETRSTDAQLLFMVKNSFNGVVCADKGVPLSTKENGGFGLRSIKEVVARNGGDLTVEWDDNMFTAYVAVRL